MRTLTAKYSGTCGACGRPIKPGDRIRWAPRYTEHVHCPVVGGKPTVDRNWQDVPRAQWTANQAAQWEADMELVACGINPETGEAL